MGTLQHLIDLQLYLKFLSDNGNGHVEQINCNCNIIDDCCVCIVHTCV